ncbi:MAG: hypothetical protein J6Q65_00840, partial [Lentisphaeria bacterium]|nr:hypothetical protein [Lentisphaeria bacterium]
MNKILKFLTVCAVFSAAVLQLNAAPFDNLINKDGVVDKIDSGADTYEYIGDNVIARGHVVIRFGNNTLTADQAVFNLKSQDIDLSRNITFSSRATTVRTFTPEAYEEALKDPYSIIKKLKTMLLPNGETLIQASVTKNVSYIHAERAFMNLKTGSIQFKNFTMKEGVTYAKGER